MTVIGTAGAVALNFFKSVSGACGALFGAILLHGFAVGSAVHAYREVFAWTILLMALALILAVVMREKPLSDEMIEVAEGKVEVPEY